MLKSIFREKEPSLASFIWLRPGVPGMPSGRRCIVCRRARLCLLLHWPAYRDNTTYNGLHRHTGKLHCAFHALNKGTRQRCKGVCTTLYEGHTETVGGTIPPFNVGKRIYRFTANHKPQRPNGLQKDHRLLRRHDAPRRESGFRLPAKTVVHGTKRKISSAQAHFIDVCKRIRWFSARSATPPAGR